MASDRQMHACSQQTHDENSCFRKCFLTTSQLRESCGNRQGLDSLTLMHDLLVIHKILYVNSLLCLREGFVWVGGSTCQEALTAALLSEGLVFGTGEAGDQEFLCSSLENETVTKSRDN